jgi:hypothetical protein
LTSREVPPGGFTFKIEALSVTAPRLAWVGPFNDTETLMKEANVREKANGVRLSTLADVEHQVCSRLPPGWCRDASNRATTHPGAGLLGLGDVIQGTKSLVGWLRHGSVAQEEIVRRTYVCNACPENRPIAGCQGCAASKLHSVMNAIVARPLPSDAVLHACAICKCSLRAKVRMKLDDLLPHMSDAQRAALPDACWLLAGTSARDSDPRT